ncbi:helix-turn-helix domain-containing protein [Streptomyces specialis]|uniref:helix-turn-helix domain-containing protein n=1 Tax=Streptomyces specialis TaxID=498367 RepID=UPI00099EE72F|nr:MerR family transcriptional regulator [Streptomyces specialis]
MTPPNETRTGSDEMTIGELAARFGLATHVLRHWEAVGLLTPARRVSGRRRYDRRHLADVAIILLGKECGLSLEQLRLLATRGGDRAERHALLERHRTALRERIAAATETWTGGEAPEES